MDKIAEIKRILLAIDMEYIEITNEQSIDIIHDLFIKNVNCEPITEDGIVYLYYGIYYNHIKKNHDLLKKYYLMAAGKGTTSGLVKLGNYYRLEHKDYQQMTKYYLMAIDKGNTAGMCNLANYYYETEQYKKMKKYFHKAIAMGDTDGMVGIGLYYKSIACDFERAKKYYMTAVDKGNGYAMCNMGVYYETVEKNFPEAKRYYEMAIKHECEYGYLRMIGYYLNVLDNRKEAMKFCIRCARGSTSCRDYLNLGLRIDFDIEVAMKASPYLERDNLKSLLQALYALKRRNRYNKKNN